MARELLDAIGIDPFQHSAGVPLEQRLVDAVRQKGTVFHDTDSLMSDANIALFEEAPGVYPYELLAMLREAHEGNIEGPNFVVFTAAMEAVSRGKPVRHAALIKEFDATAIPLSAGDGAQWMRDHQPMLPDEELEACGQFIADLWKYSPSDLRLTSNYTPSDLPGGNTANRIVATWKANGHRDAMIVIGWNYGKGDQYVADIRAIVPKPETTPYPTADDQFYSWLTKYPVSNAIHAYINDPESLRFEGGTFAEHGPVQFTVRIPFGQEHDIHIRERAIVGFRWSQPQGMDVSIVPKQTTSPNTSSLH